jgi:glycosyltransferase involved in cell wall biosynthesis
VEVVRKMEKLNLAVFNTQPPHLYFGGVERRILETGKRLQNTVRTRVYCGTKAGFNKPTLVSGMTVFPCFSTDIFFPLDNWFFNKTLSRLSYGISADVYEAHAVSGYEFLRTLRKRNSAKPFIQTIHGVLADEYYQSYQNGSPTLRAKLSNIIMWRLSRIEEESARAANLIVTVSEYSSKKIVQHYDVERAKIRVVPNGVDPQRFKPIEDCEKVKREIGINGRQCVLFVGRLIPRKGLPFLIEAAKHVVKENRETAFVIVGSGPLEKHLVSSLKKVNLSANFIFLGDVSEEMLPTLYGCADVFAFPSIQEGQGIALLEAQATAKPVVAFRVGGVGEAVLDKETGLLVNPSGSELADAILKLLSNRSLREKMGAKGRVFVSTNFSWDICAQRMLRVYHEALS